MLILDLIESTNTTMANAIAKMQDGYLHGRQSGKDTCYAYAGEKLAEYNPPAATIRFWGIKHKNMIVHGDALLPNGTVFSDIDPAVYEKRRYELVDTMPFDEFKQLIADQSKKL